MHLADVFQQRVTDQFRGSQLAFYRRAKHPSAPKGRCRSVARTFHPIRADAGVTHAKCTHTHVAHGSPSSVTVTADAPPRHPPRHPPPNLTSVLALPLVLPLVLLRGGTFKHPTDQLCYFLHFAQTQTLYILCDGPCSRHILFGRPHPC